jgi:O-acetyl-ADP-ribose deacetylase (regulator of RNase III)
MLLPSGVSGAIQKRAGTAPFRELGRHGLLPLGGAVLTGAGRLPHKAIIHVAGIGLLWIASERSVRASAAAPRSACSAGCATSSRKCHSRARYASFVTE